MAGSDLARRVRVVARLAPRPKIAPNQPQVGPLGNRHNVVDRVRRGQPPQALAPPAQWIGFELDLAQPAPRTVVSARRRGASPAIMRLALSGSTTVRGLMNGRAERHCPCLGSIGLRRSHRSLPISKLWPGRLRSAEPVGAVSGLWLYQRLSPSRCQGRSNETCQRFSSTHGLFLEECSVTVFNCVPRRPALEAF